MCDLGYRNNPQNANFNTKCLRMTNSPVLKVYEILTSIT